MGPSYNFADIYTYDDDLRNIPNTNEQTFELVILDTSTVVIKYLTSVVLKK
jgi:hypothetical protein